jgi:glucokinase
VSAPVLAVDVGGTKLAAGVVAPDGAVLRSASVPTPGADGEAVWSALLTLVDDVLAGDAVAGVGVGCGGPMAWPAGVVSPLNLPGWRGFPLRSRLAQRFPGLPVRLHNDAVALVAAEHWCGAARGYDHALAIIVATGVGGGLVLAGQVVDGATGNAGHVGHVVVDPDGPDCGCGGRGCLEAVARGPALAAWALTHGWQPSGDPTAAAMSVDARAGDPVAAAAFDRAGSALGLAIATVTATCDLEVVVVGGGLAGSWDLLAQPLERTLRRHARLPFTRAVPVVPAALGSAAFLVGAAALVLRGERYWHGGELPDGLAH